MTRATSPTREAPLSRRFVWAVKTLARGLVWRSLERTRLHRPLARFRRHRAVILSYRAVGQEQLPIGAGNIVPEAEFRRQVEWVARHRRVVSLEECLDHLRRHGEPPENCLVWTFDDGFASCREVAAPILAEHGMPATFFVIPGYTESRDAKWDDFLRALSDPFEKWIIRQPAAALDAEVRRVADASDAETVRRVSDELRRGMLTWKQLAELVEMGFSVQSHGYRHWYLSAQPADIQEQEIAESKRQLEERLGEPVRYFSCPFGYPGSFDETTARLLRKHGYEASFGGHWGTLGAESDLYALPKMVIHRGIAFRRFQLFVSGCAF